MSEATSFIKVLFIERISLTFQFKSRALSIAHDGQEIHKLSFSYRNKLKIMKIACAVNGFNLCYASDKLKSNKDLVLVATQTSPRAIKYAHPKFLLDNDLMLELIKRDGMAIEAAPEEFKSNIQYATIAIKSNPNSLYYLQQHKDNDELVSLAIEIDPMSLQYASGRLKDDENIVKKAINYNPLAIKNASARLKELLTNKEF